jgi:hypothetical protein
MSGCTSLLQHNIDSNSLYYGFRQGDCLFVALPRSAHSSVTYFEISPKRSMNYLCIQKAVTLSIEPHIFISYVSQLTHWEHDLEDFIKVCLTSA